MPESAPVVDVKALHAALDAARAERDWSWRQLAKELNVSPSTISRMANGLRPDLSAFAAMTSWLRMSAEDFYRPTTSAAENDEPALVAQLAPLLRARRDLEDRDVQHLEQLIGAAVQRFRAERHES
ncbi:helix-turn-helix protein [Frondihabitans australicus]|uniref:Helix-turn-helix protein n=2 Tax=Frondihabitans australicus TaxID=386892 RepID=A0A495IIQ2_9MICO|nr:helix-turn-helix protein [Frondihabitans australicus]